MFVCECATREDCFPVVEAANNMKVENLCNEYVCRADYTCLVTPLTSCTQVGPCVPGT
jgi:hypothetical protein